MSQDSLGGKGSVEIIQPSSDLLSRLSWVIAGWVQNISTVGDSTSLANLFPAFQHSYRKKGFSRVGMEFQVFCLCLLPLVLSLFSVPDHR